MKSFRNAILQFQSEVDEVENRNLMTISVLRVFTTTCSEILTKKASVAEHLSGMCTAKANELQL